jgi:RsiW-degrading membrane proteinase PrsW (M82 family)
MSPTTIGFALLGGILPTFVWLWFWLREDQRHPEPWHLIIASFLLGALAVPLAVPFERLIHSHVTALPLVFLLWAFIEEVLKYLAAFVGGMHTQAEDEPIDAMIYLITAALGFAAAENTLFILQPFVTGDIFTGLVTANIRFVGTTLLHVLTSATVGAAVAFSFYKCKTVRVEHLIGGLTGAIALHAIFNFLIIHAGPRGIFVVFTLIWVSVIGLLILFERVKRIKR